MCLSGPPKLFVGCYHLSRVLASFLRIISKRRNNRKGHTTLQKDFPIPNIRKWKFINFIISFLRLFKENFANRDSENFSSFNYCGEKKNAVSNFKKVISGTHNTSLEFASLGQ